MTECLASGQESKCGRFFTEFLTERKTWTPPQDSFINRFIVFTLRVYTPKRTHPASTPRRRVSLGLNTNLPQQNTTAFSLH